MATLMQIRSNLRSFLAEDEAGRLDLDRRTNIILAAIHDLQAFEVWETEMVDRIADLLPHEGH